MNTGIPKLIDLLNGPICVYLVRKKVHIPSKCWWNLPTSTNQIAQIGSNDRSRIHVHDRGGTGVLTLQEKLLHRSAKTFIILLDVKLHFSETNLDETSQWLLRRNRSPDPQDNGKLCTCNHALTRAVLGQIQAPTMTAFVYLSLIFIIIAEQKLIAW